MNSHRLSLRMAAALVLLATVACGSFSAPKSCGDDVSGAPDQSAFDQNFSAMRLANQSSGLLGPSDASEEFSLPRGDPLAIAYSGRTSGSLRVCVQERSAGGGIPLDQTFQFEQGDVMILLSSFEPGTYVLRAIVDETLVRNLTFVVK